MVKLIPLDEAPEELEEEPTQAIPTPEDTPEPEPEPSDNAAADLYRKSYTLPETPDLPVIKKAPEPEKPKPKIKLVPLEAEPEEYIPPEERGGYVTEGAKGVAAGAVEATGGMLKGAGGIRVEAMQSRLEQEARAKEIAKMQEEGIMPEGSVLTGGLVNIRSLPEAQRKVIQDRLDAATKGVEQIDLANDPFFRAGLATNEWSAENFAAAKDFEDSWTRSITTGLGSIAPYLVAGAVPGVGIVAGGAAGYAGATGEAIDRAVKAGATKEQLMEAIRLGGLPGLGEQASVEVLLEKIPLPVVGKVLGVIGKIVAKAAVEGGQEGATQVAQNIIEKYVYDPDQDIMEGVAEAAGIGAIVGGIVAAPTTRAEPKEGIEDEETVEEAGDTQPEEGVVAPPTESTEAPVGGVAATTPKQPIGTGTPPTEVAPTTPAATRPGVTVVTPGTPAPDVGAALKPEPTAIPETEEDVEDYDIAAEVEGTPTAEADVRAHEERIRDIFREENQRARRAEATRPAPPGADIQAALQPAESAAAPAAMGELPITAPQIPEAAAAPAPVTQETIGTGQALQPPAAGIVEEPVPVPQPGTPVAEAAAQEPGVPSLPAPAPEPIAATPDEALRSRLTPEENVKLDTLRGIEPEPPAAPAPTLIPLDEAPLEITPEEVAAFVPEQKAERVPGKITLKPKAEEKPAAGEKGAKFKKKKAEPAAKAPELVTTREEAAATVSGQAPTKPAPEAAPVAKAPRTQLSKDTARHAAESPELQRSTVSELPEFKETVEDVAAAHVAEHPRGERSPREYFEQEGPKIAAKVRERLAEAEETKAQEDIKAKEMLTAYGRKQVAKEEAKEARKAEMAEAETGQKKERAGKKKGKSAEGIRAESPDSTYRAYERELKKKPEDRDAALLKWGQLHEQQLKLPKVGKTKEGLDVAKERARIKEQKEIHQEERALKAQAREAEGPPLSERARTAEKESVKAIESVPVPKETGTTSEQVEDTNEYFRKFVAATAKLKLADHIDTKHQTPAENLVLYARKVARNESSNQGLGPTDFAAARELYEQGAIEELNDMIVSQQLEGSGYREELGAAPEQAWTETEEVELRRHETETGYEMGEEEALRRGGRNAAWSQVESQEAREAGAYQDYRAIEVTRPNGEKVTVRAETEKASGLLRNLNRRLNDKQGGFLSILRSAHIRHLISLVGDVDVHFVSQRDIDKFGEGGARGLYLNYSDEQRYRGMKPQVFISNEERNDLGDYAHTLLHELTHAATSQAIRDNIRGTRDIIGKMRVELERQLRLQMPEWQIQKLGLKYGFKNDAEFIAEAFSNQNFQTLLSKMEVSPSIRREIGALGRGRPPTWWQAVTAAISNAIGMISGQRGQTYMEQVLALEPHLARSIAGQQAAARENVFGKPQRPLPRATLDSIFDEQMLSREIEGLYEGVKDKVGDRFGMGRRKRDIFSTTAEGMRRSVQWFGGIHNTYERLARAHLSQDSIRRKFRRNPLATIDNNVIETATLKLKKDRPKQYQKAGEWLDDATRWQVNGAVPLSHPDNGHISKAGFRSGDQRAMHQELADRFAKLEPATQKLVRQTIDHYAKTFAVENDAKVRHSLRQALKGYRKSLPPGKTIDDAVQWVRSGGAAREPAEYQPGDKDYHDALGNTAKTLARIPELRRIKGVYAPMTRRGTWFITATERPFGSMAAPKNVPAGAVMDAENRLLFKNRADLEAWADSFAGQVHRGSKWVDPKTGAKVPAVFQEADPSVPGGIRKAEKVYIATVQNKRMEMSDSKSKLDRRAAELRAQGHEVAARRKSKNDLYTAVEEISPPQIKALIRNLEQTTLGRNTAGQEAVKASVLDAQIRMLNSPGRLERHLKRRNVLGNEIDMFESLTDYNRSLASALANYEVGPELAEADQALEDYINAEAHRDYDAKATTARQEMASELRHRIKDTQYVSGNRVLQAAKDVIFLRKLASPHYSIVQMLQPGMMTMPILSSKYGRGAAWAEMMRSYWIGGVRKALGRGFKETWNLKKLLSPREDFSYHEMWKQQVRGEPDEALLIKMFDEIELLGFGATGGIEAAGVAEAGKNKAEIALQRAVDVARQMPQAIESVNRYVTAIAAVRLAKRKGKLSDEAAIREAVLTVEESQGGYGAANNPVFASSPYMQPATQFRKFSLAAGQVYYRNFVWMFKHADPEQKKIARKAWTRSTLTTVVMAGVYGVPLIELARMMVNVMALIGVSDDDWEDWENDIQGWAAMAIGEGWSEALFRGAPRVANLDLSNSVGTDSLVLFGQPESMTFEGITLWLAKAAGGAMYGDAEKSVNAAQEGNFTGAVPWPKIIQNIMDAYGLATQGVTSKKTGESFTDPTSIAETIYKGLGFKTATEAREYEHGGGGYEAKEERQDFYNRRKIMEKWSLATGSERAEIFRTEVKEWNEEHRGNRKLKIDMGDLHRSKKERERRKKERQKERQK